MPHVFVYGTLLVPEMMHAITNRHFQLIPATARGYRRAYLAGQIYPGITASEDHTVVEGAIYCNVDAESLRRLDYFEGSEYVRERLIVTLENGSQLAAESYIVPSTQHHSMTDQPWSLEHFQQADLAGFLQVAYDCMRQYEAGVPTPNNR